MKTLDNMMINIFDVEEVKKSLSKDYIIYNYNDHYRVCDANKNYTYHYLDGPSLVHYSGYHRGYIAYYSKNKLHRDKAPAVITRDNCKEYHKHDMFHRFNAPAVIYKEGKKVYYHYGHFIKEEEK